MPFESKPLTDAEFERALLASAHADAPPHDTHNAWARFATAAGLTTSTSPAGDERRRTEGRANPTVAQVAPGAAAPRFSRAATLKWLLVGAIGGSVVTAAIMRSRQPERGGEANPSVPVSVAARAAAPSVMADDAIGATEPAVTGRPATVPHAPAMPVPVYPARHPKHAGATRPRDRVYTQEGTGDDAAATARTSSTLAAEVSRIDAARAALASGAYDQAVRLVDQYHWDFPAGVLAPDADVVALEAVAAQQDRGEVARRVALFLSRYPGDPHAPRVMWIGGH